MSLGMSLGGTKVLIAGCGDLGTRLGLELARGGAEVYGLRRQAHKLPSPLRGLSADLAAPRGLDDLPATDLVVYALAADGYNDEAYRKAYVDGVRHLLQALEGRPPRRWLHVSSTSVYGQQNGEWVDEDSVTEPAAFSGRRLLEGEQILRQSPVGSVVLRLSGIYGPGRTRLLESVRRGTAVCSQPPVYTNRIHSLDAVAALHHLAGLERPAPLYLGVDHEPALDGDVKRWLAEQLGAPVPAMAEPASEGATRAASGTPRRSRRSHKRCSNRLLLEHGFRFKYPDFRAGYSELIDQLRGS